MLWASLKYPPTEPDPDTSVVASQPRTLCWERIWIIVFHCSPQYTSSTIMPPTLRGRIAVGTAQSRAQCPVLPQRRHVDDVLGDGL
eukprot:3059771-Pyramimonas_sp.AAC.1